MRKRVLLAIGGTLASVVMGASAVNGAFTERSSSYGCGEKRVFADHFFDAGDNIVKCKSGGNGKATADRGKTRAAARR